MRYRRLLIPCLLLPLLRTTAAAEDLEQIGKTIRSPDAPYSLLVAPDGQSVFVRSAKTARLVDPLSGNDIGKPLEMPAGNATFGYCDDGKFLYAVTNNSTTNQEIRVWKAATAESAGPPLKIDRVTLGMRPLLSNDGKYLLVFTGKSSARLIDVATGKQQGNVFDIGNGATRATLSPDGRSVAIVNDSGYRLFDILSGRPAGDKLAPPEGRTMRSGPFEPNSELRFSPDGKFLFALVNPAKGRPTNATVRFGDIAMWDTSNGKALPYTFPYSPYACGSWDISADGKYIAVGGEERTAAVYKLQTGEKVSAVKHDLGPSKFAILLTAVCFSPDGTLLVTCCQGEPMGNRNAPLGEVRLWDAATGAQIGKTITFRNHVFQIAFTPDGKSLVLGATARDPRVEFRGGITGAFSPGKPENNEATVWKVPGTDDDSESWREADSRRKAEVNPKR